MRLRSSAKGYIADFWSPLPAGQPSRAKTQAWSRGLQAGVVGVLVVSVDLEWGDLCTSTRSGLLASGLTRWQIVLGGCYIISLNDRGTFHWPAKVKLHRMR